MLSVMQVVGTVSSLRLILIKSLLQLDLCFSSTSLINVVALGVLSFGCSVIKQQQISLRIYGWTFVLLSYLSSI